MAHNIREHDSMLAVGEKPWHGLGVTLKEPPATAREALVIAGLDWEVHREPLLLADGRRAVVSGAVSGQNNGQYAAMVRQDTQDILGIVGPYYAPYQNRQMASLFDPLVSDGTLSIETCGSLYNGRRVWMLGRLAGENMKIDNGDEVARYIMLAHGHDGTMAVRFGYTPIRIVCWNTLSMAVSSKSSRLMKCLHTASLESNLNTLRNAMQHVDEAFELTAEQFRLLASRGVSRVSLREYARQIVGAAADEKDWTSQQRDKIGRMVGAACEGRGNHGRTWWHAYNGVTEYLVWQRGRSQETRLDSAWFGVSATTNQEALDLALSLSA